MYLINESQDNLDKIYDNGVLISIKKMLIDGPNLEEFNGNSALLKYADWTMPYSVDFIQSLNSLNNKVNTSDEMPGFRYQSFVKKYIEYGTPYRSILLNQGLGSGKTRTCIIAAETFRKAGIPILFIGPASLKTNFIKELLKWGDSDIKTASYQNNMNIINKSYSFISANAHNILVQLAKVGIGFPNIYDNFSDSGVAKYLAKNPDAKLNFPTRSLIILEEFHNLNQKFSSASSRTAKKVYSLLYNSIDCKFIAMTGTPIINNPFEICSMLNILKGPMIDGSTLLPNNINEFRASYLSEDKLINTNDLKSRMLGLVSYYAGILSDRNLYPDLIFEETNYIKMSAEQNVIHDYILYHELANAQKNLHIDVTDSDIITKLKKMLEDAENLNSDIYTSNSYRIFSRAACNFVWKIDADDVSKPDLVIPDFTLEFTNINYKNIDDIKHFFYTDAELDDNNDVIKSKINNFPFTSNNIANATSCKYYDYIQSSIATMEDIKDIYTCAVLYVYCGLLKLPKVLKMNQDIIKTKKVQSFDEINKFLTENDKMLLNNSIKSRRTKLSDAIQEMEQQPEKYFSNDGLARHGPKMLAIYQNLINGKGSLQLLEDGVELYKGDNIVNEDYNSDTEDFINDDIIDDNDIYDLLDMDISEKVDPNIYILTPKSPLYPKNDALVGDYTQIYAKLKNITDKRFIDTLAATNNKYIVYTTYLYHKSDKYFIKGDNMYGIALMAFRNYLRGNNKQEFDFDTYGLKKAVESYSSIYDTHRVSGGPALIYSEFNNAEGIAIFSKVLEYNGFERYTPNKTEICEESFSPKYAIISGNINMIERQAIVESFNDPLNKHGQFIRVLLCTSAAAEGISLKYIRQVHILEPFWHNIKIQQVIGRARRLYSHASLPISERCVHIYKYIGISNNEIESTDTYLQKIANIKDVQIAEISELLKEVSIDCRYNYTTPEELNRCFRFLKSHDSPVAFELGHVSKTTEIVEENEIIIRNIAKLGSYKVNSEGKPIENKTLYHINISPDHKLYQKYIKYVNTTLFLFPIYDTNKLNNDQIFNIVLYGHILNGSIIPFLKEFIKI